MIANPPCRSRWSLVLTPPSSQAETVRPGLDSLKFSVLAIRKGHSQLWDMKVLRFNNIPLQFSVFLTFLGLVGCASDAPNVRYALRMPPGVRVLQDDEV